MNPLYINVMPSSSQQKDIEKQRQIDLPQYEVVQATEVVFPDFNHLKSLGRGSYGTVVQCHFRGKIAAAKLLETNIDHVHIHNEVIFIIFYWHNTFFRLKFCTNLNIKILWNYMPHLKANIMV